MKVLKPRLQGKIAQMIWIDEFTRLPKMFKPEWYREHFTGPFYCYVSILNNGDVRWMLADGKHQDRGYLYFNGNSKQRSQKRKAFIRELNK
jgi:hypothetical protein